MSDSDAALVARTLAGDLDCVCRPHGALPRRVRALRAAHAGESGRRARSDSGQLHPGLRGPGEVSSSRSASGLALPDRRQSLPHGPAAAVAASTGSTPICPDDVPSIGARPDAFEWRDEITRRCRDFGPTTARRFCCVTWRGWTTAKCPGMTGVKEPALRMRVKRASDQLQELLEISMPVEPDDEIRDPALWRAIAELRRPVVLDAEVCAPRPGAGSAPAARSGGWSGWAARSPPVSPSCCLVALARRRRPRRRHPPPGRCCSGWRRPPLPWRGRGRLQRLGSRRHTAAARGMTGDLDGGAPSQARAATTTPS